MSLPLGDLPSNLSLDVNPRKPKMTTNVAKAIIKAVESTDDNLFDINNRGIVITAKSFRFNSNNSTVTIDMGNDTGKYGILDGGHTYKAIIEHRENYFHNVEQLEKDSNLKRRKLDINLVKMGRILRKHRKDHSPDSSMDGFIDYPVQLNLLNEGWISSKSLSNIENGYNLPSLSTLKKLSIAFEVDLISLIDEIKDYIP